MIQYRLSRPGAAGLMSSAALAALAAHAQAPNAVPPPAPNAAPARAPNLEQRVTELTEEVDELKKLVHQLQEQSVKANLLPPPQETPPVAAGTAPPASPILPAASAPATASGPPAAPAPGWVAAYLPSGVTINALLDGYYEYNFN